MIRITIVTGHGLFMICNRRTVPARDVANVADLWVREGHVVLRGWYFSDVERAMR